MPKIFNLENLIFLIASLVTGLLIFFKVDIGTLQKIVAVLLLILLIFLNQILTPKKDKPLPKQVRLVFLALMTLFTQLLVLSTGGLKSPFLVLVHLFTLGSSFLISLAAALVFLILTLLTILANLVFDHNIRSLFQDDPGSILLYLVSFVVVIPLSVLITRYYYLKDAIASALSREVKLKDLQQQSLLSGLSELVIVVDRKLNIISANDSAERMLSSSGATLLHRQIFDVLFLKDSTEALMDSMSLRLEQIIEMRTAKEFNNLMLYTKNTALPRKVLVSVRPIVNLEGVVDQITFVVADNSRTFLDSKVSHLSLEEAKTKQQAMFAELKLKLDNFGGKELKTRTELIERVQQDLLYATEIEDHLLGEKADMTDIAEVCRRAVVAEQPLAEALRVGINFSLLNFGTEDTSGLVPKGMDIAPMNLTAAFFTAPVDVKWFNILVRKTLDLAILLSSGTAGARVEVTIDREANKAILINVNTNYPGLSPEESKLLLTQYYGLLSNATNLRFGSGLEGFVVKQVALALNIPLVVVSEKGRVGVNFQFKVNKTTG